MKTARLPDKPMRDWLEIQYSRYNRRRFVDPDPLACVYGYGDPAEREIAALIAASLAYGRVSQIIRSVSDILNRMGRSPRAYLESTAPDRIGQDMAGFVHRFARDDHLTALLLAVQQILERHGSLKRCFLSHLEDSEETVFPALCRFSEELRESGGPGRPDHLVACPEKGSACKRMNLFLRWLVRKDRVDPGGWEAVNPSRLIIPLDTHMFRICSKLGLTSRKQANMKTAIEITEAFRQWSPEDPVKYDFTLTRFGIRKELAGEAGYYFQ